MRKLLFSLILVLAILPTKLQAATATLNGPTTVRAGDTITISFVVNGSDISGIQAEVTYNSSQLVFKSYSNKLPTAWKNNHTTSNGKVTLLATDDIGSSPLSKANVATISFKVNSSVAVGSTITITVSGKTANTSGSTTETFTATYSKKVEAPLSGNNNLKTLSVKNATLAPSFTPTTTSYSVSVAYSVTKLDISATAEDSAAKVSIANNSLNAGATTNVTVTVTAANGTKKVYTIKAKRAADPNYKASGNNFLAELKVSEALLSPVFNKSRNEYVIYVPFEVDKLTIKAVTEDSKAEVVIAEYDALKVGNNNIRVDCIAEDSSINSYFLLVVKAPEFDSKPENATSFANQEALNKMLAQADKKSEAIAFYLDLREEVKQEVSGEVFAKFEEFENAGLIIDLGSAQLTYNSKNFKIINAISYDYSLTIPAYILQEELSSGDMRTAENVFSFRLGHSYLLYPTRGKISLLTNLNPADSYFVYYYDEKLANWILQAQNVKVDEFGYCRFSFEISGEYLITPNEIASAGRVENIEDQSSKIALSLFADNNYLLWTIVTAGLVVFILGITSGYLYERGRFRKYIKRRLENDE